MNCRGFCHRTESDLLLFVLNYLTYSTISHWWRISFRISVYRSDMLFNVRDMVDLECTMHVNLMFEMYTCCFDKSGHFTDYPQSIELTYGSHIFQGQCLNYLEKVPSWQRTCHFALRVLYKGYYKNRDVYAHTIEFKGWLKPAFQNLWCCIECTNV